MTSGAAAQSYRAAIERFNAGDLDGYLAVRHEGEFLGVAPTGASATLAITTLLTVRDGRCVERWSTADMFGLLQQLQAPASAPGAAA
jgi:hypothetical protein